MKQTRILMGMPVTVEVVDPNATASTLDMVYDYFQYVDDKFSTYKADSEISRINQGLLSVKHSSSDMRTVFRLSEQTRLETKGYFNIAHDDFYDPSGLVKGWAIFNAAERLRQHGFENYYVDAGGDVQLAGKNEQGQDWRIGIRNPFNITQIVKVLSITNMGIATSGTYIRGDHIYNPLGEMVSDIVSLTVIGPNIYEADRFATAAFAMGKAGIEFIAQLDGFEGYMIDELGQATFTSGFDRYTIHDKVN
jgi:thiamine biosynthesis lipoprotein